MMKLRDKEIPLYYQLETILRKRISIEVFPLDSVFPSEDKLEKEYGVSRITVRRALSALQRDGLIVRKRGKGTFVSGKAKIVESPKLSGSIEDIISLGLKTRLKVLDISWIEPPEPVRLSLRCRKNVKVLRIEKIRYIVKNSFSYVLNYLPHEIGCKIPFEEISKKPLLFILEDRLSLQPSIANQTIEATIADAHIANLLEIRVGDPLLKAERIVLDKRERPIEYVSVLYRADRYYYTVNLKRVNNNNTVSWGPFFKR